MTDRRAFLIQTAGALTGISLLPDVLDAGPVRLRAPVRTGIVGVGRQGRAIIGELQKIPDVTITAVCDSSPSRLASAVERAAGAEGVAAFADLVRRPDVDAVLVATPTHLHREIVEAAIAAGKHVYCEAPIAHTLEDADALAAAARATDRVIQAGFQRRANPLYQRAHPLVTTELRGLVSLYAQHHRKTSWRFPAPEPGTEREANWRLDPAVSTGLAGEIATHQLDVVCWFLDALPNRVTGRSAVRLHHDGREVADTIQLVFEWPDGVGPLYYEATLANSYGDRYEVFHGVNAALRMADRYGWLFKEIDAPTQGWEVYATRQQFHLDEGIVLLADATKLSEQGRLQEGGGLPRTSLSYALAAFLTSVTEGTPVACPMDVGARITALGILADRAARTGDTVDLPLPS